MDRMDSLLEPLRDDARAVVAFLPRARVRRRRRHRRLAARQGGALRAGESAARDQLQRAHRARRPRRVPAQGGIRSDTTDIFGVLVYWLIVLAALVVAFNALGLNYVTDLLRQVVMFVPRLMVALVILAFGAYFARFIAGAVMAYCRNVGIQDGDILGRLAQYAILAFVVLIALEQMQIGGDIVRQSFLIVLAGVVLALALAFGLGGQDWAAELLERWWPRARRDERPKVEDLPAQVAGRHGICRVALPRRTRRRQR